ncbi:MAG: PilW family protein [Gemmata sp.]
MTCSAPHRPAVPRPAPARRGFTLVELMVTLTVVLMMMTILTVASSIAAETFRAAKVQGDFVTQERAALAVLRRDLQYRHFLDEDGKPNLGQRLSDQRLDYLRVSGGKLTGYTPPKSGYFSAESTPIDNVFNFDEGADSDTFYSSRSGNHALQFTIIVPGGAPEDTLAADVPYQNPLNSAAYPIVGRAAEVAYFLVPNGTTPNGINKYKLIRRQRLCAFNGDDKPAYQTILNSCGAAPADPPEVMAATYSGNKFAVFNLNDLTFAGNRLVRAAIPVTGLRYGEDVLLSNVTSFEVKFTGTAAPGINWPRPFVAATGTANTDYPYDTLPFNGRYDTFSQAAGWDTVTATSSNLATSANPNGALKPVRITGVSIRLRCWNPKSKSSRQSTLAVDL